jgi:metallo-beta-lactamase superfamily protein
MRTNADPSVGDGMMSLTSPLYPTAPVNVGGRLRCLPADGSIPPMPGWRWIHTPGHSAGHVSFFRDRALIVGDAFITTAQEAAYSAIMQSPEMHGSPMYFTPKPTLTMSGDGATVGLHGGGSSDRTSADPTKLDGGK